ncbi:NAD(P)-dependent oxidoreductase [Alicycliphilus denitrificans]|uniref:Hydroxyacid dehydrogenase n=1 Tax=Alicycliphilus denitrificans TaxID=179636 RepID=A0A420KI31_9BURK|nr:NAD(P)-dependent oxidoreductase [Alicycliphilus denitrificans]RKJ99594.1 hydroxyacid dehydrogenase [Alicycliphilus denitrificans]
MPHLLIARTVHEDGLQLLRERSDWTFTCLDDAADPEFAEHLPHADAVVLRYRSLGRAHVERAPRLRCISRHGVGYDSVDTQALRERGITLTITPDANASAVAEHAMALLLSVARRIPQCHASVAAGLWAQGIGPQPFFELEGKRALVVGAGRIGRAMAVRLQGFGMAVEFFDPFLPAGATLPAGCSRAEALEPALARADVVSLHVPATQATRGLVDPLACRRGAILINTARGGVVDADRLLAALRTGHLYGAGTDVFDTEPVPAGHPLLAEPALVATPHAASLSDGALRRMARESVQNVLDFFDGRLRAAAVVDLGGGGA